MDPISIQRLTPLTPLTPVGGGTAATSASGGSTFQQVLGQVLEPLATANAKADAAIVSLASGQSEDVHSVAMAVAQADLAFRMVLELRNRLTEAYQEVMRMQV